MSAKENNKNGTGMLTGRVIIKIDLNGCIPFPHNPINPAGENKNAVCACFPGKNSDDDTVAKRFWCNMFEELLSLMEGEVNEDIYTQIRDEVTRIMADAEKNTALSCVAEEISKVQEVNNRAAKGDAILAELRDALYNLWQRLNDEIGSLKEFGEELTAEPNEEYTDQVRDDKVLNSHVEDQEHLEYFHALFSAIWTELDNVKSSEAYAEQRGRLNGAIKDALGTNALSELISDLEEIQSLNEQAGCGNATRTEIVEALDELCENIAGLLMEIKEEQKRTEKIRAVVHEIVPIDHNGFQEWLVGIIKTVIKHLETSGD